MIKVGIIGAGKFAEDHINAITKIKDLNLVSVCRTNNIALKELTVKYKVSGYTDYTQLLLDKNIDAVLIATPHHLHTEIVIAAAKAGKHILLEKPMAPTLKECDQIIEAANTYNVKLMVGHTMHFFPASISAKKILDSEALGNIVMATGTMIKDWEFDRRTKWHRDKELGGGVLMTVGIHYIDQLIWLLGSKVKSVRAKIGSKYHEQSGDDMGLIFLNFENGIVATVTSIGYREGVRKMESELICEKGILKINLFQGAFIGKNESWEPIKINENQDNWKQQALINEWKAFIKAIKNEAPIAVTGTYAKHVIEVVLAAHKSSELDKEVFV